MRFEPRLPPEQANVSPGSSLVELVQLVVGGVLVVILVAWLGGLAIDRLVVFAPRELEREVFRPLADQLTESAALPPAERQRVEAILTSLAPGEDLALGLAESADVNAFALPGGIVLVTQGLLDEATDEELAFVLAHEIAHHEHRDSLRALGRSVALAVLLGALGTGGAPVDLGQLTAKLALNGFSRDQEREADRRAIDRLRATGWSLAGARSLLARFCEDEGAAVRAVAWATTHPLGAERLAALEAAVAGRAPP